MCVVPLTLLICAMERPTFPVGCLAGADSCGNLAVEQHRTGGGGHEQIRGVGGERGGFIARNGRLHRRVGLLHDDFPFATRLIHTGEGIELASCGCLCGVDGERQAYGRGHVLGERAAEDHRIVFVHRWHGLRLTQDNGIYRTVVLVYIATVRTDIAIPTI